MYVYKIWFGSSRGLHFHLTNHFQRHFSWIRASNGTNPSEFVVTFHPYQPFWCDQVDDQHEKKPSLQAVFVKPPQSLKTILNYPCLKILWQQFPAIFLDPKKSSVFWSGAFLKLRFRRDRLKPFGNNAPPRHWKACQPRETPVDGLEQFISWYSVGSWSKLVVSTNPFKKYACQIGFIFPTFRGWKFPKMFEVATTQFMMFGYKNFPETNMALENRFLGKEIPIGNHHFWVLW